MRHAVLLLLLLGIGGIASAATPDPLIREQKTVTVDGVQETWQLRWQHPPKSICGADQAETSMTCPCDGFAYGEQGKLFLVRLRPRHLPETLDLSRFFSAEFPNTPGFAIVQRWAPVINDADNDFKSRNNANFDLQVYKRPSVDLMNFGDYNHDGEATEFLIQVGTLPCGKHQMIAVGISKAHRRLHVIASADNPHKPLILGAQEWDALLKSNGSTTVVEWPCEDHGSRNEVDVELHAIDGVIHGKRLTYSCPEKGSGKTFLESAPL